MNLLYNLGNNTSYEDILKIAEWHSLAYIFKTNMFKLVYDAYSDRLLYNKVTKLQPREIPSTRSEDQKLLLFQNFRRYSLEYNYIQIPISANLRIFCQLANVVQI